MRPSVNLRVVYTVLPLLLIMVGTFLAIQYANGNYRISRQGFIQGSGLLSANSFPTGAEVYVDDELTTATDDTIYLQPGQYEIRISKDGYTTWRKNMAIEEQLVTQTNAVLFPVAPSLSNLTFTGAQNVSPSPDGQKLIYYTASQSAQRKNGLYIMEMSNNTPISLQRGPKQIAENGENYQLEDAKFIWSPDSSEVIVQTPNKQMLLSVDRNTNLVTTPDISYQKKQILTEWEEEMYLRERQFIREFPEEMIQIATASAKNVYISPDKKRLLYTATEAVTIPENIVPPPPATSTQEEERSLQPGSIYVYDREEDKNFKVAEEPTEPSTPSKWLLATDLYQDSGPLDTNSSLSAHETLQATTSAETAGNFNRYHSSMYTETLQWYPDSKHLMFVKDGSINIMGYDGTNIVKVYSGPFKNNFIYPWPDGSRLVITTSFSPDAPDNLYAIELK